ncbi:hypothetical protein QMP26_41250 (plasmid) [Enterocloster clostridioformis]
MNKRIDALILVGSTYAGEGENDSRADYVRKAAEKVPVFMINGYLIGKNIYCAFGDDRGAAYDVASQMIVSGRRRILFLRDSHSYSANLEVSGAATHQNRRGRGEPPSAAVVRRLFWRAAAM